MVSEKSCWQYLKAHSETKRIIDWISSTAKSSLNDSHVLPPLTSEAYSDLSNCSLFLREVVLDELTRWIHVIIVELKRLEDGALLQYMRDLM